jgi:hypothetical protein
MNIRIIKFAMIPMIDSFINLPSMRFQSTQVVTYRPLQQLRREKHIDILYLFRPFADAGDFLRVSAC